MKFIDYLCIVLLIWTLSCDRDDDDTTELVYESVGVIEGFDASECACCGGYLIKLEDSIQRYNFETIPPNSGIDLESEQYPLNVKLNWTGGISEACINIIQIDDIARE